jgi:hypothetical protein
MKKICEKEAFIRQHMTNLAYKEIEKFDFVKSLSFKFLTNQLSKKFINYHKLP